MQVQEKLQCAVVAFENDQKLEKTIRQWLKSRSILYEPFKSF